MSLDGVCRTMQESVGCRIMQESAGDCILLKSIEGLRRYLEVSTLGDESGDELGDECLFDKKTELE